ncbi:hypothetical protein FEM33_20430 [Dyadobacter flavalbus]|uniref:DUF6602 domain-containing protein n=1 Tax=Dyadobacter flavalbus TaxID=2579942 RepID=A0A5M8QQ10_9BACT|nr:DUF6602 domain-containing protein [Dyadobacter flavalbus]KAA6437084.1 hypothetical protein FEM33_20430 [Dyadobacter flavalbus]
MPDQNIKRFQESITRELKLTKDRVRDLIGNANWGADGGYKEAILRKTISQFLPSNLSIGTGFIIGNTDHYQGQSGRISTQLDIIIYENKTPVIFREGEFIIITETAVRAVIEVKTKITNYSDPESGNGQNTLNKIINKINKLMDFPSFNPLNQQRKKFVGIFSFEYDQDFMNERVAPALIASNGLVNHISLGADKFIRYWKNSQGLNLPDNYIGRCYIRYNLRNLSFSYFISNLLHIVSDEDPIERYWFSFPIEGTKEIYRQEPIVQLA